MWLDRPLAVVTPTLDGDVLGVLAAHDVTFTTGQLHRVLGRHSEEGIRRVLRRLTRQGIVSADRVGHAYAYRLNADHLAAEPVRLLAAMRSTFLDRLQKRLSRWETPPVYAAVFGSAARGRMTDGSDVDLLLVRPAASDRGVWDDQVAELISDVLRWLGNDLRPLELSDADVTRSGRHEPVLHDVLAHGHTVAGDREWLASLLRAEARP